MPIQKFILAGICFCFGLSGYSQSFKQFDGLTKKADSAYRAKNYSLSAEYYEQAIHLPESQKSEIFGGIYYNMACVYSLAKEKEKALFYLEKSFTVHNAKRKTNPVYPDQITTDSDLDFVRNEPEFKNLLRRFYAGMPIEIVYANEISYDQLLELIDFFSKSPTDDYAPIIIEKKVIFWKKEVNSYAFNNTYLMPPNFEGLKNRSLKFVGCTFQINFIWLGSDQHFPFYKIQFDRCVFNGTFFIYDLKFTNPPIFEGTTFQKDFYLNSNLYPEKDGSIFRFDNCSLHYGFVSLETKSPIVIKMNQNMNIDSSDFRIQCNNVLGAKFIDNKFEKKNLFFQCSETGLLWFEGNAFNNVKLSFTVIRSEFDFLSNKLSGRLLMVKSAFSNEPSNNIEWENLNNYHLGLLINEGSDMSVNIGDGSLLYKRIENFQYVTGENPLDISDDKRFNDLMGLYSMFLNHYKNKNSIESYNSCFVAVKELQSKRLKFLYESHKTFETYFRWKLSQLLKFYVRHGTDPARAIVISVYIIFWFGVFFFFFPSDWDTTSKKKLIQDFKDFIQKNEKGYVIPFFILLGGFALSLINALTLSLNAFITLGFGNIPTHGIARYICVLEGFMGWFLLSIFTVALINQVL